MEKFDFTLGFAIWAANEADARVKLSDLLRSITKEDIMQAMHLEKDETDEHAA